MRAVVQRVQRASVTVSGEVVGQIGPGLLVLVAARHGDGPAEVAWLAQKLLHLRIFEDEAGKMNLSAADLGHAALVVSQFTLYADCSRGRRPSFIEAARPEVAAPLITALAEALQSAGVPVQTGVFGADMQVALVNDGPVTLVIDTP